MARTYENSELLQISSNNGFSEGIPAGATYNATPVTLTDGQLTALQSDLKGNLKAGISDPSTGVTAAVTAFHNSDNQSFGGTTYGLFTGGVAQILNPVGNLDRQRGTGFDGIPAVGVATGAQQLAGSQLSTTFGASVTGSATAQSVQVASSTNVVVGDIVLTQDNAEYVEITAIADNTHVTGVFKNNHANGQSLSWYHYNQAKDAGLGDAAAAAGLAYESPALYNGATFDRERGNFNTGALITASGATTTQTGSDQTNYNGKGVIVVLDMTTVGTGSVTLEIDGKDTASGKYYAILTGAAVTTNSTNVYTIFPGNTVTANVSASTVLPRTWRVKVTANNANATTYTVGACVID